MLFSFMDFWDRMGDARDRVRGVWSAGLVGVLLIALWVAFLLVESVWKIMTARSAPAMPSTDEGSSPLNQS